MLSMERKEKIKNLILEKRIVKVDDLASAFGVSHETARRDLLALEKSGFVIKSYGGAILNSKVMTSFSTEKKSKLLIKNKEQMCKCAIKYIKENDCIFMDHSSTIMQLCPLISMLNLTVITNSIKVINELSQYSNIRLLSVGGTYDGVSDGFFGNDAIKFLQKHNCDKAFISCDGIKLNRGICDTNEMISELRDAVIENSGETYLLADYTKFNKNKFIMTSSFSRVKKIITDRNLGDDFIDYFRSRYIKYEIANSDSDE